MCGNTVVWRIMTCKVEEYVCVYIYMHSQLFGFVSTNYVRVV